MVLPRNICVAPPHFPYVYTNISARDIAVRPLLYVWCEFALSNDTRGEFRPPFDCALMESCGEYLRIWYSYPLSHERFGVEIVCFYALFTMSKHALNGEALMRELSMVLYLL